LSLSGGDFGYTDEQSWLMRADAQCIKTMLPLKKIYGCISGIVDTSHLQKLDVT